MLHNLTNKTCKGDGTIVARVPFWPFLVDSRLVTIALFQSSGTHPWLYDCWNKNCISGTISDDTVFRSLAGSSSGPEALFGLRLLNCLATPSSPISRWLMLGYGKEPLFGMLLESSTLNTNLNWEFKAVALAGSVACGFPSSFNGGIFMFSVFIRRT